MKNNILSIFVIAAALSCVTSCKTSDPGSPFENQPPTTAITSAPQNGTTVNHFISIHWAGNDSDGEVAGFNMYIDGNLVDFTQKTDSAISFTAPATGEVVSHTFSVQAVDDDGDMDPTPPEIQFFTSNTAPVCFFSSSNIVGPNANVGQGFQIKLEATDANRSGIWFALSLDDTVSWTEWSHDSIFVFADPSLGTFPGDVVPLDNSVLTEGQHVIYGRCRDSGLAISAITSRTVNVGLEYVPTVPELLVRYNSGSASDSLYPDGSIYHQINAELALAYEASAHSYRGLVHSYRYRNPNGVWSPWQIEPSLILTNLPVGEYSYGFQARDLAGVQSDTAEIFINLVEQTLSDSILVVDETRNGVGAPTLPTDQQVDDFYAALVEGYNVRNIDMTERQSAGGLLTAGDVANVGLLIWHADDRNDYMLDDNRRILSEYMQRGGRVIFSGWDILSALTSNAEETFGGTDFEYRYMRTFSGKRDPATNWNSVQQGTGFTGENGFPSLHIDPTKLLTSWAGAIPRTWTFEPRGECTVIGRLATRDPDYFQNNQIVAYYYDLSFRCAVFGIPLFYGEPEDVQALFEVLLPRMLTGL